jgi:hypothetical protein
MRITIKLTMNLLRRKEERIQSRRSKRPGR